MERSTYKHYGGEHGVFQGESHIPPPHGTSTSDIYNDHPTPQEGSNSVIKALICP